QQDFPNGELKDAQFTDQHCPLEVVLPPEKAEGCENYLHAEDAEQEIVRDGTKAAGKKRISLNDLECDVSVENDNRQEWVFTLYDFDNSGKVTKEDMSSLMHTIYDVVDASVNQSCHNKSKTLRVKLTVTPEPRCHRRETGTGKPPKQSPTLGQDVEEGRSADKRMSSYISRGQSNDVPAAEGQHYCVDENTERRNHYLDLAGIENYTSRFEGSSPALPPQEAHGRSHQNQARSRSQEPEAQMVHHRRSQVIGDTYVAPELRSKTQFLKSPKGAYKGGNNGAGGGGKSAKCHGYHPPLQLPHQGQSSGHHQHPLQYSHSKRVRAKAREAISPSKTPLSPPSHPQPPPVPSVLPSLEREQVSGPPGSPGFVVPVVQRHE
uniref:Protein naked cuticle homolog n=1 Tax=Tetraodon nigroviridis TaxID=99883 RepID=H3C6L7_TETNG